MTKILKFTGLLLSAIILLLIVAVCVLVFFVSPNKFKPVITSQVAKYTGRQLTIDGELSWSFFPYLGVKVGHATLSNSSEFKQKVFAEFDEATVAVKLMPLLHAKVEASGISLSGLTLHLVKNADGKTDWQDLQNLKSANATTNTTTVDASHNTPKMAFMISIPSIDVNNATVTWSNEQANQYATIKQFELHAKNINLDQAFPITSSFAFSSKNPNATGKMALQSDIKLDVNAQQYQLSGLNVTLDTQQAGKNLSVLLKGNLVADLAQQTLSFTQFVGQVSNLTLTGKVSVTDLMNQARVTGHLQAQPFDLKQLLQSLGQDVPNVQTLKNVSADFDFTTTSQKAGLQSLVVDGNVKIEELQAAKVKASQIHATAKLQNAILTLSPITAAFYQGNFDGIAKINLNNAIPQFDLQAKLANVQAEPLTQDLGGSNSKIKLQGTGNVDMQVTTQGTSGDTMMRNLNGNGHINFANGKLVGINIGYMIDSAASLVKGQSVPTENEKATNFGDLTGTLAIHNGVVSNNDLQLVSPRFTTKGQGTIDLVNQQINYLLQANATLGSQKTNDVTTNNINALAIPITITGNLSSPSIRLDTGTLLKEAAKQQVQRLQDKVKEKIQDTIKDQLKNQISGSLKDQLPANTGQLLQGLLGK